MPFDALTLASIADEVRDRLVGGRIQRILQPSDLAIGLSVYAGGTEQWLVMSAAPSEARVHLGEGKLAKAYPTPSPFVMLLRKHLEGRRVAEIDAPAYERVLSLTARSAEREVRLVAEIMGRRSNIVLVDADSAILGAVKLVPPRQSRVRSILPGRPYRPPPQQGRDEQLFGSGDRIDPYRESQALERALDVVPQATPVSTALIGALPGCGPFLAEQIARRAGVDTQTPAGDVDIETLVTAAASLYSLYATRSWEPSTFIDRGARRDFAPYLPTGMQTVARVPSMSRAVESVLGSTESRDSLRASRRRLQDAVRRARKLSDARLASLTRGLTAAEDAEAVLEQGQLLLAYQHLTASGGSELYIPDLGRSIPLDPRYSVKQNAERLFRRYRKLRQARERLPAMIATAHAEQDRLADLEAFAGIAQTESELQALERDIRPERQDRRKQPEKRFRRTGPPRYTLRGYTAIVGRNARENETVTFRESRPGDLWFHARERTGAHLVLRGPDPPQDVLEAAAALAAHLSEGRADTALDVDITAVRHVRKIPGAAPGRVTYRNSRTLRVRPGIGEWQRSAS